MPSSRAETEFLSMDLRGEPAVPEDAAGGWPEFQIVLTYIVKSDDPAEQEEAARHCFVELSERFPDAF